VYANVTVAGVAVKKVQRQCAEQLAHGTPTDEQTTFNVVTLTGISVVGQPLDRPPSTLMSMSAHQTPAARDSEIPQVVAITYAAE
jgi:hypothetical protein